MKKQTKRYFICDDINNGIIINDNFTKWNNVKDEKDYKDWKEETLKINFGTFQNSNILTIIENFNPKKDFLSSNYLKEVKKILSEAC